MWDSGGFDESDLPEELRSSYHGTFSETEFFGSGGQEIDKTQINIEVFEGKGMKRGITAYGKSTPLNNALKKLITNMQDLTPVFTKIMTDFFLTNETLIFQNSPGIYKDYSNSYAQEKWENVGKIYPMLVLSGVLRESLTNPNSVNAIRRINKKSLQLGTRVEYAPELQAGRYTQYNFMHARPPVLFAVGGRLKKWLGWINSAAGITRGIGKNK